MPNEKLTGYPSLDKLLLTCFKSEVDDKAKNFPLNKTVWGVLRVN